MLQSGRLTMHTDAALALIYELDAAGAAIKSESSSELDTSDIDALSSEEEELLDQGLLSGTDEEQCNVEYSSLSDDPHSSLGESDHFDLSQGGHGLGRG